MKIQFFLNWEPVTVDVEPRKRLVEFLHDDMKLHSVRKSCYRGFCGSCTVLVDNIPKLSCLLPVPVIQGKSVITFDGFKKTEDYKIIASAFEAFHYSPCDYCYPAKVLGIFSLLLQSPRPKENEILELLGSHSCSCDLYLPMIKSIHMAAELREGGYE